MTDPFHIGAAAGRDGGPVTLSVMTLSVMAFHRRQVSVASSAGSFPALSSIPHHPGRHATTAAYSSTHTLDIDHGY